MDIGGTTIKFAFVNENGDIHLKWQEMTKQDYTDNSLAEQITTSIEHHRKRAQLKKSRFYLLESVPQDRLIAKMEFYFQQQI